MINERLFILKAQMKLIVVLNITLLHMYYRDDLRLINVSWEVRKNVITYIHT